MRFLPYRPGKTPCPVLRVTPGDGFYIHTFPDICPFSPSQRFLAVSRLPFQDREPRLGDLCDVCVIDLDARTIRTVYSTKGWGFQIGANLNWGATDRHLYTNDIINNDAVCVRIDLESGETRAFAGPMSQVAPDESCVFGVRPDLIEAMQPGHGVPATPKTRPLAIGAAQGDGLWRTALIENHRALLVSIAALAAHVPELPWYTGGTFHPGHPRLNPQGTRIMQPLRCQIPDPARRGPNAQLFTFGRDGRGIHLAVRREQWASGGQPVWHPDGEHLVMPLKPDGSNLRFCQVRHDGTEFRVLSESCAASGHPSITPDGHHIITDAYPWEPIALPNDEVPIRLVDLPSGKDHTLCTVFTLGKGKGPLRCDAHPAWSRDFLKVCFNGAPEGRRGVFLADLARLL